MNPTNLYKKKKKTKNKGSSLDSENKESTIGQTDITKNSQSRVKGRLLKPKEEIVWQY